MKKEITLSFPHIDHSHGNAVQIYRVEAVANQDVYRVGDFMKRPDVDNLKRNKKAWSVKIVEAKESVRV